MLKITRKGISIMVPHFWISNNGFLKHTADCAVKLFFGDYTLEEAIKESKKQVWYMWSGNRVTEMKMKGGNE